MKILNIINKSHIAVDFQAVVLCQPCLSLGKFPKEAGNDCFAIKLCKNKTGYLIHINYIIYYYYCYKNILSLFLLNQTLLKMS